MEAPADAIPLKEAAKLVGKSTDTLRRWRRKGALDFFHGDDGRAYVRRADVLRVSGAQAQQHPAAPVQRRGPQPASEPLLGAQAVIAQLEGRVNDLQRMLGDLRRERDDWRTEAEHRANELTDARARIASLERELAGDGGIRGLLTSAQKDRETPGGLVAEQERRIFELERDRRAGGGVLDFLRRR